MNVQALARQWLAYVNAPPTQAEAMEISDPPIPGADNHWFASQGQARKAALRRATDYGLGYRIVHDAAPTRGQPHYHIVVPDGRRVSGHFFYGRRLPRRVHRGRPWREYEQAQAEREFEQWLAQGAREAEAEARQRKYNTRFMKQMLNLILSAPKKHPLDFLVNRRQKNWRSRSHLSQDPAVQAGHLTSLHSGARERLAIEDAWFNQLSNWKGESQGAIFLKKALNIGGIPVEERTARAWEAAGLLPTGTVDRARRHSGWMPQ